MPRIEQLIYGREPGAFQSGRAVLAKSAGLDPEVEKEIVRLCELWGPVPPLGLQRAALMSFPLSTGCSSLRGRQFTVIRLSAGVDPLFHAVVLTELEFAGLGRNPFAVAAAGVFVDTYTPGLTLDGGSIGTVSILDVVSPPPSPSDVGVVDEALCQMLGTKRLHLPLEQGMPDSDRCLALLIATLPAAIKREMRFASFATSKANSLTLAAIQTNGASYGSWRRYLLSINSGQLSPEAAGHVKNVRDCLTAGDLPGIVELGGRTISLDSRPKEPAQTMRSEVRAATLPPRPAPVTTAAIAGGSRSAVGPTAAMRPAERERGKPARSLRRVGVGRRYRPRSNIRRWIGALAGVALVGICFFAWQWGAQRHLVPEISWPWGLDGGQTGAGDNGMTTLLEVVDVGDVYAQQLRRVHSEHGPATLGSRERLRALAQLQATVAGPLLRQADLFAKLAENGIQQGTRPDRETERLRSLSHQGAVLSSGVDLLELAYYALRHGADWRDLPSLSDKAATARRDSLRKVNKAVYERIGDELGTRQARSTLAAARAQVDGMAALLRLFNEDAWSQRWEDALVRAASLVAPTASPMTRAYRNCAFTLVRLKQAERRAVADGWFYRDRFTAEAWLPDEVAAVLPSFRRQAGKFRADEAPALVAETIAWYAALETLLAGGTTTAEERDLNILARSRLLRFDPDVYGQQLGRARFSLLEQAVAAGATPESLPVAYCPGGDCTAALEFFRVRQENLDGEAWAAWSITCAEPFLSHWANHLGLEVTRRQAEHLADFVESYKAWQLEVAKLRTRVVAGDDWSAAWQTVHRRGRDILADYDNETTLPPIQAIQLFEVRSTMSELTAELPLRLTGVTVRLVPEAGVEGQLVTVAVRNAETGQSLTSDPFVLGPAAPAGTGWVGTANVTWHLGLSPLAGLEVVVRDASNDEELLRVDYASLADGTGPSALTRPREGTDGKISFRMTPSFWQGLRLPPGGGV